MVPGNRFPKPQPGRRSLAPDTTVRALPASTQTINMPTEAYARRRQRPEPNFAPLVTEQDLSRIVISAHALRRFIGARCSQQGIPGAEQVARGDGSSKTSARATAPGPATAEPLPRLDGQHVKPVVLDLIRREGFWTTERPRWSLSPHHQTATCRWGACACSPPSSTVTRSCSPPARRVAIHLGHRARPRLHADAQAVLQRPRRHWCEPPSWLTLVARAWRSRCEHDGALCRVPRRALESDGRQARQIAAKPTPNARDGNGRTNATEPTKCSANRHPSA